MNPVTINYYPRNYSLSLYAEDPTQHQYSAHTVGVVVSTAVFHARNSSSVMLFCSTMLATVLPESPTYSKSVQVLTIPLMMGTGTAETSTTVPSMAWTGGTKVYQGVLMQTGT